MKEFLIKQISNYTKDASILEYIEELDEKDLKKILDKYKSLPTQTINQEVLDILMNKYIIHTFFDYNEVFCRTFECEALLNKLPEFTPEQMNNLITACLDAKSPYTALIVKEAITNYSVDDYIEIVRICNRYNEHNIIGFIIQNDLIKCFTSKKYSLAYIAAALEIIKNSGPTCNNLATIMKNDNFNIILSEFGKIFALNYFNGLPNYERELFQDLITNSHVVIRFEVFDIIELFEKANKDNLSSLLSFDVF